MSENLTDLLDCLPPIARGDRVSVPRETYERVRLAIAELAAAEERGRRSAETERDELRVLLGQAREWLDFMVKHPGDGAPHNFMARIDAALAPRDSGKGEHYDVPCLCGDGSVDITDCPAHRPGATVRK